MALAVPKVQSYPEGKQIRKVLVVPGRSGENCLWTMNPDILLFNLYNSGGISLRNCHRSGHRITLSIHCLVYSVLPTDVG
jgi:hypothetical protein